MCSIIQANPAKSIRDSSFITKGIGQRDHGREIAT
jgi:hypothetical protein